MIKKLKLPYGFQDYLPEECYNKNLLEKKLSQIYESFGYRKVETPTVEYYDTFHDVYEPNKLKNTFKLTDNDGSLLALRPDITLQICRMAAGFDLKFPQRAYYNLSSFEYMDDSNTARTREFAQIGIELLGNSGFDGDVEIVELAVKSFLAAGLDDFTVEIGNNDFFKGVVEESGLTGDDVNELTALINRKDQLGTEIFLQKKDVSRSFREIFLRLPTLFGGKEIIDEAEKSACNSRSKAALERTHKLYDVLEKIGYGKCISIDLGMLHGLNYYSGLIIKGYSQSLGLCLLDGGRYDRICHTFGYNSGAVGFAIGTKRLLSALDRQNKLKEIPPYDCVYCCVNADSATESSVTKKLRDSGLSVVKLFVSVDELMQYCSQRGIENAFCVNGKKISVLKGKVAL